MLMRPAWPVTLGPPSSVIPAKAGTPFKDTAKASASTNKKGPLRGPSATAMARRLVVRRRGVVVILGRDNHDHGRGDKSQDQPLVRLLRRAADPAKARQRAAVRRAHGSHREIAHRPRDAR